MASRTAVTRRKPDWSDRGSAAVDSGDLETAKQCFTEAVKADSRNAKHRYHLAVVLEGLWEFGAAGARLTEALRLDPKMADAARRLSLLASRCALPDGVALDPAGLKAALAHDTVDRELTAEMAMRHLAGAPALKDALAKGASEGWLAAARSLCVAKTGQVLKEELFLDVLRASVFRNPDVERLLMALRRVLLQEVAPERFEDRALAGFAIALMQQCWVNEYLWAVTPEEAHALDALGFSAGDLLAGDVAAGRKFLLASLYAPFARTLGKEIGPQQAGSIRPRALRDAVVQRLVETADERARAERMPRLGAVTDATSRKVASQYEVNPYPRWTSVGILTPDQMRRALRTYFKADEIGFLERPFDVLVAGCGTGQHAVQAALAYGAGARVVAIDLSAASLAYAARMADRFGAKTIEFAQADLQTLDALPEFRERFDVIECTGVLHHMADPFEGWRTLLKCLKPDGRMLLGLYSATARRNLSALRNDPAYPGPGCDDDALRTFRQLIMDRPDGEPGSELKVSRDFYAASNFRDLTLHVSERCLTLPEIARFLDENGLKFRGFQIDHSVFDRLRERFPQETWPGSLDRWAEYEEANTHTFNGMYIFWCARS